MRQAPPSWPGVRLQWVSPTQRPALSPRNQTLVAQGRSVTSAGCCGKG